MENDCYQCKFWKGDDDEKSELGECHRHAPRPHLVIIPRDENGEMLDVTLPVVEPVWPKTGYWHFCGEFQQNEERKDWT